MKCSLNQSSDDSSVNRHENKFQIEIFVSNETLINMKINSKTHYFVINETLIDMKKNTLFC